jgi:hypothetical protein
VKNGAFCQDYGVLVAPKQRVQLAEIAPAARGAFVDMPGEPAHELIWMRLPHLSIGKQKSVMLEMKETCSDDCDLTYKGHD